MGHRAGHRHRGCRDEGGPAGGDRRRDSLRPRSRPCHAGRGRDRPPPSEPAANPHRRTRMALKDLSEYLTPDLELPHGGKVYPVKPPTKNTGLILAAINALGAAAWSGPEAVDKVPQSMRDLAKTVEDKDLGELSLGEDVYRQMNEDGVPGPHIDTFALYALYYWTIGEESADQLIALRAGKHDPKAAARARSKSGQIGR